MPGDSQPRVGLPNEGSEYIPEVKKSSVFLYFNALPVPMLRQVSAQTTCGLFPFMFLGEPLTSMLFRSSYKKRHLAVAQIRALAQVRGASPENA